MLCPVLLNKRDSYLNPSLPLQYIAIVKETNRFLSAAREGNEVRMR